MENLVLDLQSCWSTNPSTFVWALSRPWCGRSVSRSFNSTSSSRKLHLSPNLFKCVWSDLQNSRVQFTKNLQHLSTHTLGRQRPPVGISGEGAQLPAHLQMILALKKRRTENEGQNHLQTIGAMASLKASTSACGWKLHRAQIDALNAASWLADPPAGKHDIDGTDASSLKKA